MLCKKSKFLAMQMGRMYHTVITQLNYNMSFLLFLSNIPEWPVSLLECGCNIKTCKMFLSLIV